jgi:hypothetical protein
LEQAVAVAVAREMVKLMLVRVPAVAAVKY